MKASCRQVASFTHAGKVLKIRIYLDSSLRTDMEKNLATVHLPPLILFGLLLLPKPPPAIVRCDNRTMRCVTISTDRYTIAVDSIQNRNELIRAANSGNSDGSMKWLATCTRQGRHLHCCAIVTQGIASNARSTEMCLTTK